MHTSDWTVAIELKYRTRALQAEVFGEHFAILKQAAQDQGRYDFIKDVARVERTVRLLADYGYAIELTSDRIYWRPPRSPDAADGAFRLHQNHVLGGTLAWSSSAGPATQAAREAPHLLQGTYPLEWHEYSVVDANHPHGPFRYLMVPITRVAARGVVCDPDNVAIRSEENRSTRE